MKFLYEYQDKANKRHKGTINAATRADAYAALKAQGIKPIHCDEAPGFFNLLFGRGKRWIAIIVLGVLCLVLGVIIHSTPAPATYTPFDAPTRRQIIGDAAVVEKGIRTGWSDIFELEGDRFLASFAIPGTEPAVRNTTEEKLREALGNSPSVLASESVSIEERQIRAIVFGMKCDISGLLKSGWSLRDVGTALVRRQEQEIGYYNRAKTEVESAVKSGKPRPDVEQLLDLRNDSLRKLGIRTVSMPESGFSTK